MTSSTGGWERRLVRLVTGSSILALLAVGLLLGCGGSSDCPTCPTQRTCPTPVPPTPTPEPTPDYVGFWRGSGTSTELLTFTVSDNENARNVHHSIMTPYSGCAYLGTGDTELGPFPIESGEVTITVSETWLNATIVVTFASETSATAAMTAEHVSTADPCYGRQFTDTITLTKGSL